MVSVQVYEQFNIAGRTAVVTGAAAYYVGPMARALAAGCRVAVLGRTPCQGGPDGGADHQRGGEAIGVTADVLDEEAIKAARDQVRKPRPC